MIVILVHALLSSQLNDPPLDSLDYRAGPVEDLELTEDHRRMVLDGLLTDSDFIANFFVTQSPGYKLQNLSLPLR